MPSSPLLEEQEFRGLVDEARHNSWSPEDVARLATRLAASGEQMQWNNSIPVADVASTGGPGSLSTLLAPVWLLASSCRVVKLAVPGRPAGAIDSLATVPGYRVRLSTDEVRAAVATCGFVHFLTDEKFAPADAALYQYRRRYGAVAVPSLAAASLLAKKVAVGVHRVGLDVRLGRHGNFGGSRSEARTHASIFCAAAQLLGIDAVAFLSAEDRPAQPWIGRGESLVALAHALQFRQMNSPEPWLDRHVLDCWRMAATVAGVSNSVAASDAPPTTALCEARAAFEAHLASQGATLHGFLDRVDMVCSARRQTVYAQTPGTLLIDLASIRDILVESQVEARGHEFSDPVGVRLLAQTGDSVAVGQPIAEVRCSTVFCGEKVLERLSSAFRTQFTADDSPSERASENMEVVRA